MDNAAVRDFTGIHNMIRGLVQLLDSALAAASPDNQAQLKLLGSLGRFAVAGTLFHHSTEDDYYWPAVIANGADPRALDSLVAEHHEIDPLIETMKNAFTGLPPRPADPHVLDALRTAFDPFAHHLLAHLDNEEPIFFPLLNAHMPDEQTHELMVEIAKKAPKQGLSWLMGGVEYGMTAAERAVFLSVFPKPILWVRPLTLRKYRSNCGVLGVDPATPAPKRQTVSD